jgi:hypothetical protein
MGAVSGGVAGIVASIVIAFLPSAVTAFSSYISFNHNIAIEVMKGGKNPADAKALLDLLCTHKFIEGDHCPAPTRP